MSERTLNWGLLSTARINQALINPIRASERNQLLAVASRTPLKAQEYARAWGIPKYHGSYEALLDDPDVDVIYNSLPNSLHLPWTLAAARAGKHVLCEKPLALTAGEVKQMAEVAQNNQVTIAEAFMYRHHPQTLKVKELVDSGRVGQVRLVRGTFSFRLDNPEDVRLKPDLGGGSIWDIGCYPISYIRMIFDDEPLEVYGEMDPADSGVDFTFVGQLRFSGGRFGQFESSFAGPLRSEIEIVGSEGSFYIPNPYKPGMDEIIEFRGVDRTDLLPMPGQELYIGEVEDLADTVLLGKPPRISLEDSRRNIALIQALLASAQKKQPVSL